MRGFKIVDCDMCGWNKFKYVVGQRYQMSEPPEICKRGLHFCLTKENCLNYVNHLEPPHRCFVVESTGNIDTDGFKSVTNDIRLLNECDMPETDKQHSRDSLYRPDNDEDRLFALLLKLGAFRVQWEREGRLVIHDDPFAPTVVELQEHAHTARVPCCPLSADA